MDAANDVEPVPASETVWSICHYMEGRNLEDCKRCPEWESDPHRGLFQRGCYVMAREVVNIVQTGNAWRKVPGTPELHANPHYSPNHKPIDQD